MKQLVIQEGDALDRAMQDGDPVEIVKSGKSVAVLLPATAYRKQDDDAWETLRNTRDRMAKTAEDRGLTDEVLEELLADES